MLMHLPIIPILLPALVAVLLLLPKLDNIVSQRVCAFFTCLLLCGFSILLVIQADVGTTRYLLGDWPAPYGIELVADRVSALFVLLTSLLGVAVVIYAMAGDDRGGNYFYPLLLLQIMGINGAFLTGDLFNLFVFFEVLLMASYALVVHGGGKEKTHAAIQYVILNLIGSALFLLALGIIYATVGTLNMTDLAIKLNALEAEQATIAKTAAGLLLIVFGLKSAILPLHFWLSKTYTVVAAPIAALFAVLTKVGFYSLLKASVFIFGDYAGLLANVLQPWLLPMALLTVSVAGMAVLSSPSLRQCIAYLVVLSSGTLLFSIALGSVKATGAGLYYAVHSTLIAAALFLLVDIISDQRGQAGDRLVKARTVAQPVLLGLLFVVLSIGAVGMPPFSGFVGKLLLLQSAANTDQQIWIWSAIFLSSLLVLMSLVRAGIVVFWAAGGHGSDGQRAKFSQYMAIGFLFLMSLVLIVYAGPITEYLSRAAMHLHDLPGELR